MKRISIALLAAVLILALSFHPAAAAALARVRAAECGTTYVVQGNDNLSKIAIYCGTSVANILAKNPQITNPNLIYPGQVISLSGVVSTSSTTTTTMTTYPYTSYSGKAQVSLSATQGEYGETITVNVKGFPPNSWIDYRVGEQGEAYSTVYDGTVASDGTDSQTITLPSAADYGEYWVVVVTTTSQREVVAVTSPLIYIDD